jgi:hypothetical protein
VRPTAGVVRALSWLRVCVFEIHMQSSAIDVETFYVRGNTGREKASQIHDRSVKPGMMRFLEVHGTAGAEIWGRRKTGEMKGLDLLCRTRA